MNIDIKFFKNLYSDDIIYHYTKASTAIDFILYNLQLKFSKRKKSNDPIESNMARRGTVYWGYNDDKLYKVNENEDTNELHNFITALENNFYQICFCKNHMGEDFASENYWSNFEGHEELFGFTKPRMWDQYADKFTGVCIAFSKEKLLSLNNKKLEIIPDDVKYFTYRELSERKMGDIQGNYLQNVGVKIYRKQIEKIIKDSFFYKHVDYEGENEYRLGTCYDKSKCSAERLKSEFVFDKSIMLDISGCIEAIFMSSYANDRQKSYLLEYAIKLNIPLIEMNWQHNSFKPRDYRSWIELVENLEKQ